MTGPLDAAAPEDGADPDEERPVVPPLFRPGTRPAPPPENGLSERQVMDHAVTIAALLAGRIDGKQAVATIVAQTDRILAARQRPTQQAATEQIPTNPNIPSSRTQQAATDRFSNPFLVCGECGERAEGFHNPEACGCEGRWHLTPCGHNGEAVDLCPSWGPVDGCRCSDPAAAHKLRAAIAAARDGAES